MRISPAKRAPEVLIAYYVTATGFIHTIECPQKQLAWLDVAHSILRSAYRKPSLSAEIHRVNSWVAYRGVAYCRGDSVGLFDYIPWRASQFLVDLTKLSAKLGGVASIRYYQRNRG